MREGLQSVAEFMRHPGTDQRGITEFYTGAVGLPVLRAYPTIVMLWAGEDLAFELKYDTDPAAADDSAPDAAQYVPIFRSYDLAVTRRRLADAGYPPVWEGADGGTETFLVLGPDRQLTGFQWRDPDSSLTADIEARRRRERGPVALEGVAPMPPELQYLSRVVLHCPEVARTSRYLSACFGLDCVATEGPSAIHSLGDTVVLEVAPGGRVRRPPRDRNEVGGALLMRVHDLDDLAVDAEAAGAVPVGDLMEFPGGVRIRYYAEPGGAVIGFVERGRAGDGVEDREAARRWATRRPQP